MRRNPSEGGRLILGNGAIPAGALPRAFAPKTEKTATLLPETGK
jgi:hypothetical protein